MKKKSVINVKCAQMCKNCTKKYSQVYKSVKMGAIGCKSVQLGANGCKSVQKCAIGWLKPLTLLTGGAALGIKVPTSL